MRERLLFPSLHILKPERWMIHGWGKWITTKKEDTFHPLFIKNFEVKKKTCFSQTLYLRSWTFEAKLNGKKSGEEVLTPYYNNYHDEEQYLTFDVMENIKISITIQKCRKQQKTSWLYRWGNGWYKRKIWTEQPEQ